MQRRLQKTRKHRKTLHGGFYPSIMGGVVQNAAYLIPVAARQGLTLFSQWRKQRKARKTMKRRGSGLRRRRA